MTPSPRQVPESAGPGSRQAAAEPTPAATEPRVPAPRLTASQVPSIKGISLSPPGTEVTLLNISVTGMLVEGDHRFRTGADVMAVFDGTLDPPSVPGRVVRCAVASINTDGVLKYHVGIEFRRRVTLDDAPKPVARRQGSASASPSTGLRNRW